jgi:hypothetical protein
MEQNVKLSAKQRRMIGALLTSRTIGEACKTVGITRTTLARWHNSPMFQAALTQAEDAVMGEAGRQLLSGITSALSTLDDVRQKGKMDSDRRQAAESWVSFALRWREKLDIEKRIAALEAVQK